MGNPSTGPYAAFADEFSVSRSQLGISWGLPPQTTHLLNAWHRVIGRTVPLKLNRFASIIHTAAQPLDLRATPNAPEYKPAATVTAAKMSAATPTASGSSGVSPKSWREIQRLAARIDGRP